MLCATCKQSFSAEALGTYVRKGVERTRKNCVECRQKKAKYSKKYRLSDKGKATTHASNNSESKKKYNVAYNKSAAGQVAAAKYRNSEKGKANAKLSSARNYTDARKQQMRRFEQSDAGKIVKNRWRLSAKGVASEAKAKKKKNLRMRNDPGFHMSERIRVALTLVLTGHRRGRHSSKLKKFCCFTNFDELKQHFESLFAPGMTWSNRGEWHIGHRIAKSMYQCTEADLVRAWDKSNLFPQWAHENLSLGVKLPSDDELLKLQHLWPLNWNGKLPSLRMRSVYETIARGRV